MNFFQRNSKFVPAVLLTLLVMPVWPQTGNLERGEEIKRALQRGDYHNAAALADSAIAHFEDFMPAQLAEIHTLRALLASQRNETAAVDAHFRAALQLARDFRLDPIFFSPALQNRFEQIRSQMPTTETPVRVETRYVMVPDQRVAAAWRSLVLPGWGQRFKGQKIKGNIFLISAATLAGATAATQLLRAHAKEEYLKAEAGEVEARYRTFNRYHLLRNNLALGLGIVWGASALEALIVRATPQENRIGIETRVLISPTFASFSVNFPIN